MKLLDWHYDWSWAASKPRFSFSILLPHTILNNNSIIQIVTLTMRCGTLEEYFQSSNDAEDLHKKAAILTTLLTHLNMWAMAMVMPPFLNTPTLIIVTNILVVIIVVIIHHHQFKTYLYFTKTSALMNEQVALCTTLSWAHKWSNTFVPWAKLPTLVVHIPKVLHPQDMSLLHKNVLVTKTPITLMILDIPRVVRAAFVVALADMIKAMVTVMITTKMIAMNGNLLCPKLNKLDWLS